MCLCCSSRPLSLSAHLFAFAAARCGDAVLGQPPLPPPLLHIHDAAPVHLGRLALVAAGGGGGRVVRHLVLRGCRLGAAAAAAVVAGGALGRSAGRAGPAGRPGEGGGGHGGGGGDGGVAVEALVGCDAAVVRASAVSGVCAGDGAGPGGDGGRSAWLQVG